MIEFFSGLFSILLWLPLGLVGYFNQLLAPLSESELLQKWQPGIVYSYKQAESLGLNPEQTYSAILDELQPKYLRIIAYWDRIEKNRGSYDFSELDFQMDEAEKKGVQTTLILGRKVPRWPECHLPAWYVDLDSAQREKAVLGLIEQVVKRYQNYANLEYWQLENEIFFTGFGNCPKEDNGLFKSELSLLKSLDSRPVLNTSSGELDTWLRSFIYGDKVGVSVYQRFFVTTPFFKIGLDYPLPPLFYHTKAKLFQIFFKKDILITEFQLEPWLSQAPAKVSPEEQFRELDLAHFKKYINYALHTRIPRVYFWGVEWWYWLKQNGYQEFFSYVQQNIFNH